MLADVILDGPYGIREPTLPLSVVRRPCVLPRECGPPSLPPSVPLSLRNNHSLPASRCGRQAGAGGGRRRTGGTVTSPPPSPPPPMQRRRACSPRETEGGSVRPVRRRVRVRALFNGANHRLSSFRNSAHYWHRLSAPAIPTSSDHPSIPPPSISCRPRFVGGAGRQARRVRCTIRRTESKMAFLGRCSGGREALPSSVAAHRSHRR